MLRIVLIPLLLLAACASPGQGFRNAEQRDVSVDGFRFAVFQSGDEVQVIRLGWVPLRERDRVPPAMLKAAAQATGCTPLAETLRHQLPGDTAEGKLRVKC